MGRPKQNFGEQTQIRITREAYSAVRKAAEIRRMTAPAYVSMVALQAAHGEIVEDARRVVADADAERTTSAKVRAARSPGHAG